MTHLIGQDTKDVHSITRVRLQIILDMEVGITYIIVTSKAVVNSSVSLHFANQ